MHEDAADVFEFVLVTCVMTCALSFNPSLPLRLRLVTSQGSPYPSRSPRAHPSGWTRTQGLSRMDSHAPPFFWDAPLSDVELAAGSSFTSGPRIKLARGANATTTAPCLMSGRGDRLRPAQTALDSDAVGTELNEFNGCPSEYYYSIYR